MNNLDKVTKKKSSISIADKLQYINSLDQKDHISMQDVKKITGLDEQTLRKLFDTGILTGYRIENLKNKRMFSKQSIVEYCNLSNSNSDNTNQNNYTYIRAKTKEEAKQQEEQIKTLFPNEKNIIKIIDISKNINHNKKGLQRLLLDCTKQKINKLYIAHKDILGRVHYDMINKFVELSGGTIVNLNLNEFKEDENIIISEIIKIVHHITNNAKKLSKKNVDDLIKPKHISSNEDNVEGVYYDSD